MFEENDRIARTKQKKRQIRRSTKRMNREGRRKEMMNMKGRKPEEETAKKKKLLSNNTVLESFDERVHAYYIIQFHVSYGKGFYFCSSGSACDTDWIKTPRFDSCVRVFGSEKDSQLRWSTARRFCQESKGDLATIRDETMSNFIRDRIVAHFNLPMWIGFHKSTGEERWHWLDEDGTVWNMPG
ncbi:macrophage mannose receptor 1 [Plakobranchus ocellatus]|uniref:Macrophage mannose receptor 1 n=1 Tax=Plakobranchus ocellatus TaxID=259542 RepID=A0AAV4AZT5_9GAST|nr:macrophage mannose receptor 1 [Plakobranchus ocellatus]